MKTVSPTSYHHNNSLATHALAHKPSLYLNKIEYGNSNLEIIFPNNIYFFYNSSAMYPEWF